MPYKLLIDFDISFESPFRSLLRPREVIRGDLIKLVFSVTNLGTDTFPGGEVRNWRILCGPERDVQYTSPSAQVHCKAIEPGHRIRLPSEDVVPLTEGLAWIRFSIEPEGEDKEVAYYQGPQDILPESEWTNWFYVVNRELLHLTSVVEELAKKLKA